MSDIGGLLPIALWVRLCCTIQRRNTHGTDHASFFVHGIRRLSGKSLFMK